MKKYLLLIAAFSLMFAGIACDSTSSVNAELEVSVSNINFGEVRIDETRTETITITNLGDVILENVQVEIDGLYFSVLPLQFDLEVGSSQDIVVTFEPEMTGDFNGVLTISSEIENITSTVNLAGFAVDVIVGSWLSEAENIAPGLAGPPFNNVSIEAEFNSDDTYFVESTDAEGAVVQFTGTYQTTEPNSAGIRGITLNQSTPAALVSSGIFRIEGNTMQYEVIQEGLTGVEPPTVEGGFGSTSVGGNPTGPFWIQSYVRVE